MGCIETVGLVSGKLYSMFQLTLQGDGAIAAVTRFVTKKM